MPETYPEVELSDRDIAHCGPVLATISKFLEEEAELSKMSEGVIVSGYVPGAEVGVMNPEHLFAEESYVIVPVNPAVLVRPQLTPLLHFRARGSEKSISTYIWLFCLTFFPVTG